MFEFDIHTSPEVERWGGTIELLGRGLRRSRGDRELWALRRGEYPPEFQEMVDALVVEAEKVEPKRIEYTTKGYRPKSDLAPKSVTTIDNHPSPAFAFLLESGFPCRLEMKNHAHRRKRVDRPSCQHRRHSGYHFSCFRASAEQPSTRGPGKI